MSAPRRKSFVLTPSYHRTNDVIDINDKDDIKYYLWGAKPLFSEREDKFYCTPDNLNDFLQDLDERLQEYVWDYNVTGIAWGDRSVIVIAKALYSNRCQ